MVLPTWAVTLVAEAPGGAQPSYAAGLQRARQRRLPGMGRVRAEAFERWLHEHVMEGSVSAVSSSTASWSADEMMTVAAARHLRDG